MTARPMNSVLRAKPGPGGDGAGGLAGIGGADGEADGGDLVFGLVHEAAHLLEDAGDVVRRRGGRSDGVHGQHLHPRGHDPEPHGLVAVHHDHGHFARPGRDLEAVLDGLLRELVARLHELSVELDDLFRLLAQRSGRLPREPGPGRGRRCGRACPARTCSCRAADSACASCRPASIGNSWTIESALREVLERRFSTARGSRAWDRPATCSRAG